MDAKAQEIKKSRVYRIWSLIVVAVLVALYLETQDHSQKGYNVVFTTDETAVGKSVKVDGKTVGSIEDGKKKGGEGGVLWLKLDNGQHTIEISEQGKKIFEKKFKVKGKEYLRFDLESPARISGASENPAKSLPE